MGDKAAKVASDDTMPSKTVFAVKLLLEVRSHLAFNRELCECPDGDLDGVLLHLLDHVDALDRCPWIREHLCFLFGGSDVEWWVGELVSWMFWRGEVAVVAESWMSK